MSTFMKATVKAYLGRTKGMNVSWDDLFRGKCDLPNLNVLAVSEKWIWSKQLLDRVFLLGELLDADSTIRKHISKSKCTKHTRSGPLFAVQRSKKWHAAVARRAFPSQHVKKLTVSDHFCEAHFQVKMLKAWGFLTTLGGIDLKKRR